MEAFRNLFETKGNINKGKKILGYSKFKKMNDLLPKKTTSKKEVEMAAQKIIDEYQHQDDEDSEKIKDDARRIQIYADDVAAYINSI